MRLGESENDNILAGLIFVGPHFVKSTLGVGESENDNFLVGLTLASPRFVKSTFGAGDSENDNVVDEENIDSEAHCQAHSGPG